MKAEEAKGRGQRSRRRRQSDLVAGLASLLVKHIPRLCPSPRPNSIGGSQREAEEEGGGQGVARGAEGGRGRSQGEEDTGGGGKAEPEWDGGME